MTTCLYCPDSKANGVCATINGSVCVEVKVCVFCKLRGGGVALGGFPRAPEVFLRPPRDLQLYFFLVVVDNCRIDSTGVH